jgi:hypothetical protein
MPKVRIGKTEKERKSGVHGNRFANRAKRVAWGKDNNATNSGFPRDACNGKRNRYRVTGKDGASIVLK